MRTTTMPRQGRWRKMPDRRSATIAAAMMSVLAVLVCGFTSTSASAAPAVKGSVTAVSASSAGDVQPMDGIYDSRCLGAFREKVIYVFFNMHDQRVRLRCGHGDAVRGYGYKHIWKAHGTFTLRDRDMIKSALKNGYRRQKTDDVSRKVYVWYRPSGGCWIVPVERDRVSDGEQLGIVTAFYTASAWSCDHAHIG